MLNSLSKTVGISRLLFTVTMLTIHWSGIKYAFCTMCTMIDSQYHTCLRHRRHRLLMLWPTWLSILLNSTWVSTHVLLSKIKSQVGPSIKKSCGCVNYHRCHLSNLSQPHATSAKNLYIQLKNSEHRTTQPVVQSLKYALHAVTMQQFSQVCKAKPDMIRTSSKALFSAQWQPTSIHQITKELPASWYLEHFLSFVLGNSTRATHPMFHAYTSAYCIVWACILMFVRLRGKIRLREWCCEVVGSCKVQQGCEVRFSTSSQPGKNLHVHVWVTVCVFLSFCCVHSLRTLRASFRSVGWLC